MGRRLMSQTLSAALPFPPKHVARPARYTGGEWGSFVKSWDQTMVRVCIAYPDTYEGAVLRPSVNALYASLNAFPDVVAERVFAPWPDYVTALRSIGAPLTSLESRRPLSDFDVVAICYPDELSGPTILELLDLAHLPTDAIERDCTHPLVLGWEEEPRNPEPLAKFLDAYLVGDVEVAIQSVARVLVEQRTSSDPTPDKSRLLMALGALPGVYVPSQYGEHADGRLGPRVGSSAPAVVNRVVWEDLSSAPSASVVPHLQATPDRPAIEADRGCPAGCDGIRFGLHWGPFRSRGAEAVAQALNRTARSTGFQEIALHSTCLHHRADRTELVQAALDASNGSNTHLRLPVLAPATASADIVRQLRNAKQNVAIGPIVFGTGVEGEWMDAMSAALVDCAGQGGLGNLRITAVLGHPMAGDPGLLERDGMSISRWMRAVPASLRQLRVAAAFFVPRAFTVLERTGQLATEEMSDQLSALRAALGRRVSISVGHEVRLARIEAAIARGGRETGEVVRHAWNRGCYLSGSAGAPQDADVWNEAFTAVGLSADLQAGQTLDSDDAVPWSHLAGWQDPALVQQVRLED